MSRRSPAALPSGRTTETTGDGGTCDASFIPTAIRRLRSTGCGASSAPRARMLCSMVRFLWARRGTHLAPIASEKKNSACREKKCAQ